MITVNESAPRGGKTVYGATLGILMLETEFPRVHGDVGNAATLPFPVLYKVVPGATAYSVVKQDVPAVATSASLPPESLFRLARTGLGRVAAVSHFSSTA